LHLVGILFPHINEEHSQNHIKFVSTAVAHGIGNETQVLTRSKYIDPALAAHWRETENELVTLFVRYLAVRVCVIINWHASLMGLTVGRTAPLRTQHSNGASVRLARRNMHCSSYTRNKGDLMGVKDCRKAGCERRTFFLHNFVHVWKGCKHVKQTY